MIHLTKEIFEGMCIWYKIIVGSYSSEFSSIDRMDIVNLAGIHKYNALTIFQRVIIAYLWVIDSPANLVVVEEARCVSDVNLAAAS